MRPATWWRRQGASPPAEGIGPQGNQCRAASSRCAERCFRAQLGAAMMTERETPRISPRDRWELQNWLERFCARERRRAIDRAEPTPGGYACMIMVAGWSTAKQRPSEVADRRVSVTREPRTVEQSEGTSVILLALVLLGLLTAARLLVMHHGGPFPTQPPALYPVEGTYLQRPSIVLPLPSRPWADSTRPFQF